MAPTPESDPILPQGGRSYQFSVEPAQNALYSLLLLNKVDQLSGLDSWVTRTVERLPAERLHRNRVVIEGLHYAVLPSRSFPSFMAYLDQLTRADPLVLRDQLAQRLWAVRGQPAPDAPPPPANPAAMLASLDSYLDFLRYHFKGQADLEIESEAYGLMTNPPLMHEIIVEHLRTMWHDGLAAEWERVRPLVHESAQAFRRMDLSRLDPLDVARLVVGQEVDQKTCGWLDQASQLVFVPSAHVGPYVGKLTYDGTFWFFFGARLPEGATGTTDLTRSDLLVRLNALTDDTRLRVLGLLAHEEELCAPDLMARLDVSQSAVSRHLRQLVAAGYVQERWREGSKCYQLNRERIGDTLRALGHFLGEH